MPTYTIVNKKSKKTKEKFMSISEMEVYEKDHPNEEILCGAPIIHSGRGLGLKSMRNDTDFTSRVKQISKKFPRNTLRNYV